MVSAGFLDIPWASCLKFLAFSHLPDAYFVGTKSISYATPHVWFAPGRQQLHDRVCLLQESPAKHSPIVFSFRSWCCAGRMTLSDDVNLEEFVMAKDELSGADIKAACTEAGLLALRERRMRVTQADFRKAKEKVLYKKKEGVPEGLYM